MGHNEYHARFRTEDEVNINQIETVLSTATSLAEDGINIEWLPLIRRLNAWATVTYLSRVVRRMTVASIVAVI